MKILAGAFFILTFFFAGFEISGAAGYAWGENIGWLDTSDMVVSDDSLTGYIYSGNFGWINLNCSNDDSCATVDFGITNSNGTLSGYAWGENIGWLDFSKATIDTTTSEFSGHVYSGNVGWISLNCSNDDSCATVDYSVTTDWAPTVEATGGVTSSGSVPMKRVVNKPVVTTPSTPAPKNTPSRARNLYVGDRGSDVRALQIIMNFLGYKVAEQGPGSPGNETDMYGDLTKDAVARFQTDRGVYPNIGYFGPLTRSSLISYIINLLSE